MINDTLNNKQQYTIYINTKLLRQKISLIVYKNEYWNKRMVNKVDQNIIGAPKIGNLF